MPYSLDWKVFFGWILPLLLAAPSDRRSRATIETSDTRPCERVGDMTESNASQPPENPVKEAGWGDEGDQPPNDVVEWLDETVYIRGEVLCVGSASQEVDPPGVQLNQDLALVVYEDELRDYLDEFKKGEVEIPETYGSWNDDWDFTLGRLVFLDDAEAYIGASEGDMMVVKGDWVQAALRELDGPYSYDSSEYVLHDCRPASPVLEGPTGAILISPWYHDPWREWEGEKRRRSREEPWKNREGSLLPEGEEFVYRSGRMRTLDDDGEE